MRPPTAQIFERQGLKMERDRDGSIRVFQPPGERNALGQIRFNFPNKFLVYQHDTPEKHYFAQDKRAYSHGCMRVQDPMKYAEVLLSFAAPKANYTADSIKRMLGGEEKQIDFQNQIPVHVTYQTAFVDEAGKLQIPRRRLRPRRQADVDPQGQRAAGGGRGDRAAGRPQFQADAGAGPEAAKRGGRRRWLAIRPVRPAFSLKPAENRLETGRISRSGSLTLSTTCWILPGAFSPYSPRTTS